MGNYLTFQCCQSNGYQLLIKDKPLTIEECKGDEIRYPALVTTRVLTRRVARDSGDICDLSDTCVSHENGVDEVISKIGDSPSEDLNGETPQRVKTRVNCKARG